MAITEAIWFAVDMFILQVVIIERGYYFYVQLSDTFLTLHLSDAELLLYHLNKIPPSNSTDYAEYVVLIMTALNSLSTPFIKTEQTLSAITNWSPLFPNNNARLFGKITPQ